MRENEVPEPPPARAESREPEAASVLRILGKAAGVAFDPVAIRASLTRAAIDVAPTLPRAARQRLSQAAEPLGLQIISRQLSVREAVAAARPDAPLAIFAVTPDGTARWFVLTDGRGDSGRLARVVPDDSDSPVSVREIADRIGAANADVPVEWLTAQPAPLLSDAGRPADASVHEVRHGPPPLRRLVGLLGSEWRDLLLVVVYAIGVGVLSLAIPITAMAVVNTTALSTLVQQLVVLCLALLVSLAIAAILRALQTVIVECLQQRLFVRVAADLAHRLPRIDLRAFDRQHGPELVNRFFDVLTVQKSGATLLLDGVAVVLQMAVGLMLLGFYHQFLLAFDLVLIAGLLVILLLLGRGAVDSAIRESRTKYAVAAWIEELARLPLAFKGLGGARLAEERADELAREYILARRVHFRIVLRQFGFALVLQVLASTALLAIGGYLVIHGQLTLGQLVAAEIVVSLVVASFTKLGKQLENYYDLLAAIEKLGHLLDLPLERSSGAVHAIRGPAASVRIRKLGFAYSDHHRPVIDDLNLDVAPGERLALLGRNGAGKSTLVDLLFGLRAPTAGRIEFDGMDLRDLRLDSLREQVALVRGLAIIEGSVADNVRMGRPAIALSDVRQALMAVDLLEDVLSLPEGLHTPMTAGGSPLSLGQCERLMLARAIAGQPRLLILDESLDDMDRQSRTTVLPAILGPESRATVLVITHSAEVAALCRRSVHIENLKHSGTAPEAHP